MFAGAAIPALYAAEMKKRRQTKPGKAKAVDLKPKKNGKPSFDCKICSAEFNKRFNRDRHMTQIHKAKPPLYRKRLLRPRQDIFGTTITAEEVTKKSPKRKATDVLVNKDVKKMKTPDKAVILDDIKTEDAPTIIPEDISTRPVVTVPEDTKAEAIPGEEEEDTSPFEEEEEEEEDTSPPEEGISPPEEEGINPPEEEEGINPPEEDGDKPPPHNDKFNLIQMPLGKEVVVTVFITTK